jgi:hypothetical protein
MWSVGICAEVSDGVTSKARCRGEQSDTKERGEDEEA